MKQVIDAGVLVLAVAMMASVGNDLTVRHFRELAPLRWRLAALLLLQAAILPLLAVVLVRVLSPAFDVSAGLLLLAACPIGDVVNLYALIARSSLALSVTLNALSCLLCVMTMPVAFALYARAFGDHAVFAVPPGNLVLKLALVVVVPVAAGMCVRRFRPRLADRMGAWLRNGSVVGVVALIVFVFVSQAGHLGHQWRDTLVGSVALIGCALVLGVATGRALGLRGPETATTAGCFAVRNAGLATMIAVTLLGRVEFALFCTIYFVTEVPILLALSAAYRRWAAPDDATLRRASVGEGSDRLSVHPSSNA